MDSDTEIKCESCKALAFRRWRSLPSPEKGFTLHHARNAGAKAE